MHLRVATVSAGVVYVISDDGVTGSTVVAVDATGSRSCSGSPKVCSPLWTYRPTYGRIADAYPVSLGVHALRGHLCEHNRASSIGRC